MRKLVYKTALITFAGFLVVTGIVSLIVGVCSPISFARLFEDLGINNAGMYFYVKHYEKNKDINNLHLVVSKSINFESYDNIIKYYELLEDEAEYDNFIAFIDAANYSAGSSIAAKVALSHEDDFLKCRYVYALAKTGEFEKAFNYAADNLQNNLGEDSLHFVFSGLSDYAADNYDYFDEVINGKTTAERINEKYDTLISKYETIKDETPNNKYLLACYSSKICKINRFLALLTGNVNAVLPPATNLNNEFNSIYAEYQEYIK